MLRTGERMSRGEEWSAIRRTGAGAAALLAAWLLMASASAQVAETGAALSLEQAMQLAVERSQLVAANRAQALAAREMEVSAGRLPDPVLKAGIDNVPVNGPDRFSTARDFMTQRSIGVMQEFTREDKRQARSARFEREAEVGEAQRELTAAQVRRDAALAWLERSYRESARQLLDSEAREAALQIEAADSAYRAGRGSQSDVFAARTQLEQIRDRLGQTEQDIAAAAAQLSRWIGSEADRPLADRAAADSELPPEVPPDGVFDGRLDGHPQLAVMAGQAAMAEADVALARANRRPDWSWELTYSQRGSSYSNMVSVNVSVPVPWNRSHLQDRELAARLAQRDQAGAEREDARRALAADARAIWQRWRIQGSRLARYDGTLIPLAEQRTAAALAAYRGAAGAGGAGTPLTAVLEARRGAIETKLERLNIDLESARLRIQLAYLVAAPPRDSGAAR
jgi:outer membrane protein TolC